MALQFTVEKIDTIPEPLRAQYVKTDDGKYRLDLDGYEDPVGLKSALDKERTAARDAVAQAKAWKSLGKTPEDIQALLAAQEQAERDKLTKAGEWDKLRGQMTEQHQQELTKREETAKALRVKLERHLVDGAAATAIAAANPSKGGVELLLPHVKARVKVIDENGDFVVRVVDAAGNPRVNGKGEFLSIADLVGEMRQSEVFAPAFLAPPASGGGAHQSAPQAGSKNATRAQFDAMGQFERMAFSKAGGKVVE
jgi:hypothetical protein